MSEGTELQVLFLLDGEVVAEARAELHGPAQDEIIHDTVLARRLDALAAITGPLADEHGIRAKETWPLPDP